MRHILICQHRTCHRQGAAPVLAAFQSKAIPDIEVVSSGCLGQCGNGPMVLVLPEEIWYAQVQPQDVSTVAERHLHQGQPVQGMLYRKFHP